jgi:hypothetical protein
MVVVFAFALTTVSNPYMGSPQADRQQPSAAAAAVGDTDSCDMEQLSGCNIDTAPAAAPPSPFPPNLQGVKVGITDAAGATTSYPATIIGKDAMHDLAVLRIEAPQGALQPLAVGTSADLKVRPGQAVGGGSAAGEDHAQIDGSLRGTISFSCRDAGCIWGCAMWQCRQGSCHRPKVQAAAQLHFTGAAM